MKYYIIMSLILISYAQHITCWTHTFINKTPYTIETSTHTDLLVHKRLGTVTLAPNQTDSFTVGAYCPTAIQMTTTTGVRYVPIQSSNSCQNFDFTFRLDDQGKVVVDERGHVLP